MSVWRDGNAEIPTDETAPNGVWAMERKDDGTIWIMDSNAFYETLIWKNYFWVPIEEIQMPEKPEPKIEPCPFCVKPCEVVEMGYARGTYISCTGDDCYNSPLMKTKGEAIDAHNALARKVRE